GGNGIQGILDRGGVVRRAVARRAKRLDIVDRTAVVHERPDLGAAELVAAHEVGLASYVRLDRLQVGLDRVDRVRAHQLAELCNRLREDLCVSCGHPYLLPPGTISNRSVPSAHPVSFCSTRKRTCRPASRVGVGLAALNGPCDRSAAVGYIAA